MTDRHAGYFITLEENMREDDAQATLNALRQIRGVLSVDPRISDTDVLIATARARREIREKLINLVLEN